MKIFRYFTALSLILPLLVSCDKNDSLESDFLLYPIWQEVSGIDKEYVSSLRGYAYYIDIDQVDEDAITYEMALSGEIPTIGTSTPNLTVQQSVARSVFETMDNVSSSSPLTTDSLIRFRALGQTPVFIIVVDTLLNEDGKPAREMFAWRQVNLQAGLSSISAILRFREWKAPEYTENSWQVRVPVKEDEEGDDAEEGAEE